MNWRRLVSSTFPRNAFTGVNDRRCDGSEMPNRCRNGNGWLRRYYQMGCLPVRTPPEFGVLAVGVPRCYRVDAIRSMPSNRPVQRARRGKSPSQKISPEISPPCAFKKSSNFKDLRKISPISPISPGCRGCVVSCAQNAIARLDVRPIECASEGRFWPSLCLRDMAASTKSTKSTKYPRNIHEPQSAQTRANARFPENIHEIHEIHGIPWMLRSCAQRCEPIRRIW